MLKKRIEKLYWSWIQWKYGPERLLAKHSRGLKDAVVLQIGSNDGLTGDPLHRLIRKNSSWRAVFVEPIDKLFTRLKRNYGNDPRFTFINAAVASKCGQIELHYIDTEQLTRQGEQWPAWLDQIATTNVTSLRECEGGRYKSLIRSTSVECVDGAKLVEISRINRVDILHIDAEGQDFAILQTVFAAGVRPKIVLIEHVCLGPETAKKMHQFLTATHRVRNIGNDFFCLAKRPETAR